MNEHTEHAVLEYLNNDSEETLGYQSLTTIFERVIKPGEPRADAYDVEDEIESKEELRVLLDGLVQDGLLESFWGERDYEASYRLTDQGIYQASGFDAMVVEPPPNAILTEAGQPLMTEDGQFIVAEDTTVVALAETSADSAAWTGLTATIIDARNARVISRLIDQALNSLSTSDATNFQIMQATAYLRAAKELTDAPEPPSEEIWRYIGRAADLVGLLGVFCGIFAQAVINAQTY